jgi:hypothetical protein
MIAISKSAPRRRRTAQDPSCVVCGRAPRAIAAGLCSPCQRRLPLTLLAAACTPGRYVAGVDGMVVTFRTAMLRDADFVVLVGVQSPYQPGLFPAANWR